MLQIGLLSAAMKSFQVLFLLFLPILYHEDLINEVQLGYTGSLLLIGMLIGSAFCIRLLQRFSTKQMLLVAICSFILGGSMLLVSSSLGIMICFVIIGMGTGIGMSTVSDIQYKFTANEGRFSKLANISMIGDIMRICFPAIVGLLYKFGGLLVLECFALVLAVALYIFVSSSRQLDHVVRHEEKVATVPLKQFVSNKGYMFGLFMDFLDGFSSSTLFVFLPLLLAFKGINFENAVLFQSIVFAGYLCGRWLISALATRFNGYIGVGAAEIGMLLCIIGLLLLKSSYLIILLCFLLGIFTRGTSPVIKGIVFDHLKPQESATGSAIFMFVGNCADILGQFAFGLLFAGVGIYGPFGLSGVIALMLAIACLLRVTVYKNI